MTTRRAPHAAPLDAATSGTRRAGAVLTLVLAGLSMFGPFNVDAPLPAFARMGAEFHVEPAAMQQVVSVYLLSFAVMSLFHGPVSDAVGRKPVMTVGIGVYVLASVGCALAPSLPLLLVFRAFQGFAAGAGQIIARAVIRDLFSGPEAQRLMSQVSMIFGLAPAFAPILGGALLTVGDWRSIFWFLTAFDVVMTICVSRFLPETLPVEQRSSLALGPIVSALLAALRSGRFLRIALAASLAFAGQFLFISNAPLFLGGLLGLGENEYWMFFVPMVVCMIAGSWLSARAAGHLSAARQASYGLLFRPRLSHGRRRHRTAAVGQRRPVGARRAFPDGLRGCGRSAGAPARAARRVSPGAWHGGFRRHLRQPRLRRCSRRGDRTVGGHGPRDDGARRLLLRRIGRVALGRPRGGASMSA